LVAAGVVALGLPREGPDRPVTPQPGATQ
jgi:hypothetical protein